MWRTLGGLANRRLIVLVFCLAGAGGPALCGCEGTASELELVQYSSNSKCILIQGSPYVCIFHDVATGQSTEVEGTIETESPGGDQWLVKPMMEGATPWTLVQRRDDGAIRTRKLPTVPGAENARTSFPAELVMLFGPGEGQISAAIGDPWGKTAPAFFAWRAGQAEWAPADPPSVMRADLIRTLNPQSGPHMPTNSTAYRDDPYHLQARPVGADPLAGANVHLTARADSNSAVAGEVHIDPPDGRSHLKISLQKTARDRIGPPSGKRWSYTTCRIDLTDAATGKSRPVWQRDPGLGFQEQVLEPMLDLLFAPFSWMFYTDA
ncbi:MAG: hypothetical protein BIFFINMI_01246 [Phycisphaerae bacterium]|nr:hypothetical protein [Phycisphaerae bacterium]